MPTTDKPNILLIMSDEHNADVMSTYGNDIVQTPNLDTLSRRGITFDCAYTNSPLCVPARLAFTAGKYVSRCGAWSNKCWLPSDDIPSLPRIMSSAGYDSLLCGKMHYDATRRYGFTEIGGNFNLYNKSGQGRRRRIDDETINTKGRDGRFSRFHPGDSSKVLDHDRRVTTGTIDFIRKRKKNDSPFFLLTGYLAPHFPLIVPQQYWEPYRGRVPLPQLPPGSVESQPLNYHHLRRGFGVVETDPEIVRMGRELYYGLTQWVDEEIGKVLAALDDSGLTDNTIIIYTSDHGENIGEHQLWWKNCMYDHAARIPLIVSFPQRWEGKQRRTRVCSLADLGHTVAELAGADVPEDWNGDSMCSWMDDDGSGWKDFAVSEYYGHNIASGFTMIRYGRYKYVYHTAPDENHPPQRELYDMETDPGEFDNLASEPGQQERIKQLHAQMVGELGEDPEATELRCRFDYSKGYSR